MPDWKNSDAHLTADPDLPPNQAPASSNLNRAPNQPARVPFRIPERANRRSYTLRHDRPTHSHDSGGAVIDSPATDGSRARLREVMLSLGRAGVAKLKQG
jgi:hypothetical protein